MDLEKSFKLPSLLMIPARANGARTGASRALSTFDDRILGAEEAPM